MKIKSHAVTLIGSAFLVASSLKVPAQITIYTDGDNGTLNAGSWSDSNNWTSAAGVTPVVHQSPATIGASAIVQIGVLPSANSSNDVIVDTGGNAIIASLTFNNTVSGTSSIINSSNESLTINGAITNNSNFQQNLSLTTIAGTLTGNTALYSGGTGGLLFGSLLLGTNSITTSGVVEDNGTLQTTIASATSYGHIGNITSDPALTLQFHIDTSSSSYVAVAGDFFQIATGTFQQASLVINSNDPALPNGLSWISTLIKKGIAMVQPTAGTTVINSGVVLPIDKDDEFNVAGTAIIFNGTSSAAELLTDNAETATGTVTPVGTPFSTSRNITINANSNSVIAAMNGTTATYSGVISDAGGTAGTLTIGDATNHGTVVLATNNSTYTGGTTVRAGTVLRIANTAGSATGTGAVTLAAGNTVTGAAVGAKIGGQLNLVGTDTITTTAGTLTLGNLNVTGAGNQIAIGASVAVVGTTTITGTTSFADNGTYTGTMSVGTGTLTGTGSVSGAVTVAGGTINGTGLGLAGGATFSGAAGTNTLAGTETGSVTVAGGSSLTQSATGTLTGALVLGNGATTFTGTGATTVGAVTLNGGGNVLAGTGTLTTSGVTVNGSGNTISNTTIGAVTQTGTSTLVVNGTAGNDTIGTNSTLSGTGTVGTVSLAGTDTLTSTGTLHTGGITVGGSGNVLGTGTITGTISQSAGSGLTVSGTGGADNLSTSATLAGSGTGSVGAVSLAGGNTVTGPLTTGLITVNGTTQSTIAGTITSASGASQTAGSSLKITGSLSGPDTLAAGATTLTGTAGTVGAVTINGSGNVISGTLTTGGITVNNTGNTISGTDSGLITQTAGSGLTVSGTAGADNLGTSATLTGSGTGSVGAVTLAGGNTITGPLTTGLITVNGTTQSTIAGTVTSTSGASQTVGSSLKVTGTLTGPDILAAGATTLTGTAGTVGAVTLNGSGNVISGTLTTGGITVNNTGNTISGTDSGLITQTASSALTVSGTAGADNLGTSSTLTGSGTGSVGALALAGGNTVTGPLTTGLITVNGTTQSTIAGTITSTSGASQTAGSSLKITGSLSGPDTLAAGATTLTGTSGTVGAVTLNGSGNVLSGTLTTGGITVNNTNNTISGTDSGLITQSAGSALTVSGTAGADNLGTSATLTGSGTGSVGAVALAGGNTITGPLTTGLITVNGTTQSTIAGTVTSASGASQSAGSSLAVTGHLTGPVTLAAGTTTLTGTSGTVGAVTLNGSGNVLSGTLTTGGITVNNGGNTLSGTDSGNITQNASSTLAVNGTGGADAVGAGSTLSGTGTVGAVTLAGTDTLTSSGTLHTSGITVSGTGNVFSAGTITGNTTLNAGSALAVNNNLTGTMSVGSGTLTGTGAISGAATVGNGGTIGGSTAASGTLSVGGLTTAGGSNLNFAIASGGLGNVSKIAVTAGTLSIGGATTINLAQIGGGTITDGFYTLLTYSGTATGLNNLTLASTTLDGQTLTLDTSVAGQVRLDVTAPVSATTYTLGSSSSASRVLTNGTTTVTSTITNTGSADTLDYTGLNATASGGTITGVTLPKSGTALAANGGTASGTATFTAPGTAGAVTITPTVTTATNTNLGGNSTLTNTGTTTINVVNQRTITATTPTIAEGRFLTTTAPTGSTTLTSSGLHATTGDATVGTFTGTGTNGLTLTTASGTTVFNGSSATQNANYTVGGTATAGTINGTFTAPVTAELGTIAPVTVAITGDAVNQRTFTTSGTGTIALGRFLTTTPPTGSTTVSSSGLNNVTANATVNGFTGTGTNGLTLTTADSNVFNGGAATQNAVYNIGGTATAGTIAGTFSSTVTAEFGTIAPITVAVTGNAVNQRTFTVGTPTIALGRFLVGSASTGTTTVSSSGLHNVTADATVNGFTGTNTNGLTLGLTTGSNVFQGATASQTATYGIGGTATAGTINGSFSSTVTAELGTIAPITVAVTGDAVNQRTFTVGTPTIALGRFLVTTTPAGTTSVSSTGLNNVTANATLGNFTGTGTNGLSLALTSGNGSNVFTGGSAGAQTATYAVAGTATAGTINGTFSSTVTAELGTIAPVTVAVTGDAVNQRTFTQSASTIALGRFIIINTPTTGTDVITSTGLNNVTANATLGAFIGTNTNGLTLTTGNSTTFNGGTATQSATYTLGGTAGAAGAISGTFTSTVAAELGTIAAITVNVTADAVNKRTITNGAATNFGVLHTGSAVSGTSSAFTTTGLNATTTSVSVAAGSGTADANGVKLTGAATIFDGSTLNQSGSRTFSGTITSATGGTVANTINLGVTSLENGGAGLAGEGAYAAVGVGYTAFVYTGQGVWNHNGGGTWGTVSAAPVNWTANGGTPGLDANFTTTDTATFGSVTTAGTAVVTLDGDNPSLRAITFDDPVGGSYNLSQGSGGTIHMNAGAGNTATITNTHGGDQISAPIELDSNTAVSVASAGDTLTLSGNISGAAANSLTLGAGGPGKIILGGINTFTGATTITSGLIQFASNNALTSSSSVTMTGGTLDVAGHAQTLNNFSSTGGTITNSGGGAPTTITFNFDEDPINSSDITGNIAINKTGVGTLILTGNNSYTGGTTLTAGVLSAGSATAFGTGDFNNVGGTLTSYNTQHSINIAGNYTQGAGGTLFINLNTDAVISPNNDILNVTGTAQLDGGLDLRFAFLPVKNDTFTVVTAAGGIVGPLGAGFVTPLVVNQPGIVVSGTETNNGHDVTVTVTQAQLQLAPVLGSYATPNRTAILTALSDPSLATTDPTLFNILATLVTSQSAGQLPASMADTADQFNPAKFGNFVQSTIVNNAVFNTQGLDSYWASQRSAHGDFLTSNAKLDSSGLTIVNPSMDPALANVGSRLLAWSPASIGHGMLSDTATPVIGGTDMKATQSTNESISNDRFSAFVVGNVVLAQNFSQTDVAHSDTTTGGMQLGADYRLTPHLRAGALFGYNHTDGTLDNLRSKATIDTYAPGAYVSYADSGWYANGVASYGFNNYTEDRHLSLLGGTATAHGAPSGSQITANIDGGYDFHAGKLTYGPLAGLQYTHLSVDSYNEDGAGALGANLAVGDQSGDSLRSRLGGHISYLFQTGKVLLTPHLDASWQHEFMDQAEGITAGIGGVPFTVTTSRPSRDSVLLDGGLNADLNGTVSVFGDYMIQAGQSNYFGQSVQAGVKIGF